MKKILLFIFLLIILAGCKAEDLEEKIILPPLVSIDFPVENTFEDRIFSIGTLESGNELEIVSEVSGTIKMMYVEEGEKIKNGQKLFKFDTFTQRENLKVLESQLKTSMDNKKLEYDESKKSYENNLRLFENGAISKNELDNSLNEYKQNEKIYENSKVNYEKQVSIKEKELRDRIIYSPMEGKISEIYIDVNQYVSGNPVLKISDDDSVHIESQITVKDARKVSLQDKVTIYIGGEDRNKLYGKVKYVDDNVNQKGLVDIEVSLDDSSQKLYEGQYTELEIIVDRRSGIQIPRSSLIKSQSENYVYIYDEGFVELRKVETGISYEHSIEILTGLSIMDPVVISGVDKLKNGLEVRIE